MERNIEDSGAEMTDGVTAADVAADLVPDAGETLEPSTAALPAFLDYNVLVATDDNVEARAHIAALEKAGIEASHISYLGMVAKDDEGVSHHGVMEAEQTVQTDGDMARSVAKGAVFGGGLGAAGGALAGLALTAIPGVGTLAGIGLIGAALGGATGGGPLGAVWGGYSKLSISDAWEHTFVTLGGGRAIVGVLTDDPAEFARAVGVLPATAKFYDHEGKPASPPNVDER
jgi:hypothetical protein